MAAHEQLCWIALPAALLATLIGCHASSTRMTATDRLAVPDRATAPDHAPPPPHESENDPYDWHGLLIAPFGTMLKDIPLVLHEVLLFRDDAHGGAPLDAAECYATDAPGPRFVGRAPDEYVLCFKQDRLSRIQASVHLTTLDAPDVFAAACTAWLKNAAPAATPTASACAGHDGAIHFSGHLAEEAPALSITLDSAPDP